MRVLLVHNFYRSSAPSGEDEVVRSEQALLEQNGFEVIPFTRHNDDIGGGMAGAMAAALSNAWSFEATRELRRVVAANKPDVAHFHNTFPQISPAAYSVCREAGVPVVQTLHNYRMFCANGLLNRGGKPCESCVGRAPLPALAHGCYRESRAATVGMVLASALHRARGTYLRDVDRYIVLTEFARRRFIAHGIPEERLVVRGNGLPFDPGMGAGDGGFALYVGRLTAEKGVATLIRAWQQTSGIPLRIAGDGELRTQLERQAAGLPIEFLGRMAAPQVMELMQRAAILVVPSECYEGFPRVVVEAFATGTPLVAADLGGLGELVDEHAGLKFAAGDAAALARAVTQLWREPGLRKRQAQANRRRFETQHSPLASITTLSSIYRLAAQTAGPTRPRDSMPGRARLQAAENATSPTAPGTGDPLPKEAARAPSAPHPLS
jgi:glycosyltransferase involved in cell wall biosynthesis